MMTTHRRRTAATCVFTITLLILSLLPQPVGRAALAEGAIPAYAWTRPIGQPFPDAGRAADLGYPLIDDGPVQGAPLGGVGAGTIGRTYAGDFARWHLNVGKHNYQSLAANMFSVYTRQGEQSAAQALYTGVPTDQSLGAWKWNYPVGAGTYWALYPRSGFVYTGLPVELSVEQFSPVIPNDYQASSYPVATFTYTATNAGKEPVSVGLMFTWQNLLGSSQGALRRGGLTSQIIKKGDLVGVQFGRKTPFGGKEWDGTMAIAAQQVPGVTLGTNVAFDADGDGADIWSDFAADGALNDPRDSAESKAQEKPAAGVSATFTLQPGQSLQVPFFLAWDQPVMTFGQQDDGESWYKRYTAFFGRDGAQAWALVTEAAKQRETWSKAILDWQQPILSDPQRPDWFKTALFNELYYIVDGGTAWENGQVGQPEPPAGYLGSVALLECFDYLFYATFDVDFYASFAMLQLWPELEKKTVRDFAATVPQEDQSIVTIGYSGLRVPRKLANAVPHDLGSPDESPWLKPNAFTWQDVNRWKDLNAKFVLRVYRDAVLLNDPQLARDSFAAAKQAMDYLAAMDQDGDGIPENEGVPDQTYDTWPVKGVSAYSGGLWLAALRASAEMAKIVGDTSAQKDYETRLAKAQTVYEEQLWTGTYYAYDSSSSPTNDSIMADQLAGQWYLDFSKQSVLPADHVEQALRTIYQKNVAGFGDGKMGAVNGARPDGKIDTSDVQSQEVWTGTTFALASTMMNHGLRDEAWKTAYGVYHVIYETRGWWFRTPEAYYINGTFRAGMYLRPLAIWAVELAYRNQTH